MGSVYTSIDENLQAFIEAQQMFFVATAPLAADGHVNLSPKGLESFRILSPTQVGYVDLVGSGIETVAHLRENGRITIQFCAYSGAPRIVRLYGRGRAIETTDAEWREYAEKFPPYASARAVVLVDVERVGDSCGYGVPIYEYVGQRTQLPDWAASKGAEATAKYAAEKNRESIDGLPGLRSASPD